MATRTQRLRGLFLTDNVTREGAQSFRLSDARRLPEELCWASTRARTLVISARRQDTQLYKQLLHRSVYAHTRGTVGKRVQWAESMEERSRHTPPVVLQRWNALSETIKKLRWLYTVYAVPELDGCPFSDCTGYRCMNLWTRALAPWSHG